MEQLLALAEQAGFTQAAPLEASALTVRTEGNQAIFEVADDGCGIPREKLAMLFTGQLYGTATPTDDRRNGMGIGLSVCAAIIRAHGGTMDARNLSTGAEISFRLPLST